MTKELYIIQLLYSFYTQLIKTYTQRLKLTGYCYL